VIVSYNCSPCSDGVPGDRSKADAEALSAEIIVVDNASDDGTVAAITDRFPTVEVIANPHELGVRARDEPGHRPARRPTSSSR
jgi:GT2 family glycosyltransferase